MIDCLYGTDVRLKTIVDNVYDKAVAMRDQYGFEQALADYDQMLLDPEIDVVDIATPPFLHIPMAEKALKAGKHVICEKPLTGYFGREGDGTPIGTSVKKSKMYKDLLDEMDALRAVFDRSGRRFMYAENWVYATAVRKTAEMIALKKSKILYMRSEESLGGSSSPAAGQWAKTGGGILIRCGAHAIGAALYLKQAEAMARGEAFGIQSLTADVGVSTRALSEAEHKHLNARPQDVEDYSVVSITFLDGTKATILSTDLVLGGTQCYVNAYCNDSAYECQITHNNLLNTFQASEDGLENYFLAELLPGKLGWNNAFVSDEVIRGYSDELEDFMLCVAEDKEPQSGFEIAYLVTKIVYAAYLSAEEGRPVSF